MMSVLGCVNMNLKVALRPSDSSARRESESRPLFCRCHLSETPTARVDGLMLWAGRAKDWSRLTDADADLMR